MFNNKKLIYNLKNIKGEKIIPFIHLGLGDQIICNGIINYISNNLAKEVFLPVKNNHAEQISFLYSENANVNIFEVKNETRNEDVENFAKKMNIQILKIGYEKVKKNAFNTYFYKQLNLPYEHTYNYFSLPKDVNRADKLQEHLFNYFKVENDNFILVHSESSYEKYDLEILSSLDKIYINKESDIFGNMFLYENLIKKAKEIHCINGSFFHLVERVKTDANLFYHHQRKNNMYISSKWTWVDY
tara:strand:- start:300 stop:1031 length:732 start_codon:yes stop_codon:yes gene_type:complete